MPTEIWQDGKRTSRCRHCEKPIVWASLVRGDRDVAFDAVDGEIVVIETQGVLWAGRVKEVIRNARHNCAPF